jgi:hypothetical protein
MATPGTFLIPVPGKPAVVDTAGEWHQILTNEGIDVTADANDNKDVTVTASVVKNNWTLPFSSTENAIAFGSQYDVDALENNAWLGDALYCSCFEAKSCVESRLMSDSWGHGSFLEDARRSSHAERCF